MGNAFCCSCSSCQGQNQIAGNFMPDDLLEVQSMDDLNVLIDYIDGVLRRKDTAKAEQKKPTEPSTSMAQAEQEEGTKPSSSLGSFVKSGRELMEKFSTGLSWHLCKKCLLSALDSRKSKVLAEVLKEGKSVPCVGMAFSIIAYLLERAEQVSSNQDKCFRLLRYMFALAKHMKDLDIHMEGYQEKLDDILRFIVKATVICATQMEPKLTNWFCRCICASLDYGDLQDLESQLQERHEDLKFEAIIKILNIIPKVLDPSQGLYPHYAVSIQEAEKKVIGLLNLTDQSVRVVVIFGVGGIGKTTLAQAVFNRLDLRDYNHCRVEMDQDSKPSDLKKIQEQILRNLFNKNITLDDCTQGKEKLCEAFGQASKPVFLFIDNALKQSDLEMLLPTAQLCLPSRSRILLTTRNLNEVRISRIQVSSLNEVRISRIQVSSYKLESLSKREAKRLLCHHALGDVDGSFDPAVDMDGLLQMCEGIPLLLKLIGRHICTEIQSALPHSEIQRAHGNQMSVCNEILKHYEDWKQGGLDGGEEESKRIVDFVYGQLKTPSKEAFLDIVFFFHGWERSKVADIVGEIELRYLEGAALVSTNEERNWSGSYEVKVKVHDIVRERGRRLSVGNRITDWDSWDDVHNDKQKLQEIKGIWLRDNDKEFSLEEKDVDLMNKSLRVLCLGRRMRLNGRCNNSFGELRFLVISYEDMLPLDLRQASRLIFFQGHLIKGSEAKFTLNLPDSLRLLSLDGQEDSPVSINGHFTSVTELRLSHITFENFETNITSGNFSCLKILDMSNCSMVERLPENFGNLSCLQTLRMSGCSMLERLPQSFDQLSCLHTLEIHGCERICILSDNFGQLKCLKFLNISNCEKLKRLPEDIISLTSLAAIKAIGCASLEAKAMDSFLKSRSLMFLDIDESPMLIKRWKEIQQHPPPLIGLPLRLTCLYESYEEIESAMFFSGESRFLHVDDDGHLAEMPSSFPDVGVKVCLFFTEAWDILSQEVKQKVAEVASQEFQIIYVGVGTEGEAKEEREKRIREVLVQLPEGSRVWTSPFYKTRLLFAHSLWRSTGGVNTSILGTSVLVDGEGRRKLSQPFEKLFDGDNCDNPRVELMTLFNHLSEAYSSMHSIKKTVVNMDMDCYKCRLRVTKSVTGFKEIDSIQFNTRNNTITVLGAADAVCISKRLEREFKRACFVIDPLSPFDTASSFT